MVTEIFRIDASWAEKLTKTRVQFLLTPTVIQGVRLDLFYPVFLTLQFAFFVGWLKVAETLINSFGEDDDDFELNRLIDRHVQVATVSVTRDT